jgi:arginyl-tRNA synthetase
MISLLDTLSDIVGKAFESLDLPFELGAVKVSDRPDLAQFQCNGAMAAAKIAKTSPRGVAEGVVDILKCHHPEFEKLEIAGPGFINLSLSDEFLQNYLHRLAKDDRLSVPVLGDGTVVLDYGGPNIAKPMHVGHLRAALIGDALRRIIAFAGYKALGDVHMGDWGTHLGLLLSSYEDDGKTDFVLGIDASNEDDVMALFADMGERYPRMSALSKEDEAVKAKAQETTVKLQNKEQPYYDMWQKIREVSVLGMKKNYDALGVHFDLWKGEADVHDYIEPMVEDFKAKGLAVESDGALVVPVAQDDDKKEMPPMILYKRDGAVMYGTTDAATLVERVKLYDPKKIVYVVDQRQSLHFEQVFRAARKAQIVRDDVELTHAGFGTMNGQDGKPFKTRAGGVMRLDDLLDMALEKARARMSEAHLAEDMDEAEREDVANKVAIAAVKFADLQNQRQSDYVFDLDRLTMFEGKTGPYMLYQAVRIKSLLRKAEYEGGDFDFVLQDADKPLALLLTQLPEYFEAAVNNYAPHHLCEYAYTLAQTFSSFYGNCHIMSEEDAALKQSRLALCALTYAQLELVLDKLGIQIPERM